MPFLLASIFVEFLHVDPQFRTGVPGVAVGQAPVAASRPAEACPACLWLRIGVRLNSRVLSQGPARAVSAEIQGPWVDWPDSPVQYPTALRGPPAPALV